MRSVRPRPDEVWVWATWGEELMNLHIGYETIEPAKLKRADKVDEKLKETGSSPKVILKADKEAGRIVLDSETTLSGIPTEAWEYRLGNRCALEWILDQYKEKKPKDPTIREKFNTYRFADYKEKVIDPPPRDHGQRPHRGDHEGHGESRTVDRGTLEPCRAPVEA
jgi:predicted helicase